MEHREPENAHQDVEVAKLGLEEFAKQENVTKPWLASCGVFGEIRDYVELDGINVERYVKELTSVTLELAKAAGRVFEQEHLRLIAMITAVGGGGVYGAHAKCK